MICEENVNENEPRNQEVERPTNKAQLGFFSRLIAPIFLTDKEIGNLHK